MFPALKEEGAGAATPTISGARAARRGRGSSVVALNWFYESFYQRIFPNRPFDVSPHYLILDEQVRDLAAPYPPRTVVPTPTAAGGGATGTADRSAGGRAPSRFDARLRRRAGSGASVASSPSITASPKDEV